MTAPRNVPVEASSQHRRVDALGAFVGSDEERADHGAGDAGPPGDAAAAAGLGRRAGVACPVHAPGFLADDGQVAVHEADDADHDGRHAQRSERVDEGREGRRVGQQQGHLHAEPALDDDGERVADALLRDGQAERSDVDGHECLTRSREDERQGHDDEGQHDPRAANQAPGSQARQARGSHRHEPDDGEGHERARRQQRDAHDGRHGEQQLEPRVEAMDGAVARDVAVKLHAGRPSSPGAAPGDAVAQEGSLPEARRLRARSVPRPHIRAKTMTTPTSPATIVAIVASSRPGMV